MIDFIGDIHGHADKLKELLNKLGYSKSNETYSHPERKVLFVGDYIDRGPKIVETLEIVRSMVDTGNAIALMGNHEYNALCFHYLDENGGHLRKHYIKNIVQHFETLKQFQNQQIEYDEYIEWFMTLPLFYESDHFRAVHACWDNQNLKYLGNILDNNRLTDDLIYQSVEKNSKLFTTIEETLKGKEIQLPEGINFTDKDGTIRTEIRIKWWENPLHMTYNAYSVIPLDNLTEEAIEMESFSNTNHYPPNEKPVFFGHYWLKGSPSLFRENVCCLDYSVAKEGHLVAYRFDNEQILDSSKLVFV